MTSNINNNQDTILVVEDDSALQALLEDELTNAGYRVRKADDAETAAQMLDADIVDLVISDLRLPGSSGMDLLSLSRQIKPAPAFIIITAFGTVEQAVAALKKGADDFLTKPLKLDHLQICVKRVIETRRLQKEVLRYRKLLGENGFHGMIGHSQAMKKLFDSVRLIAHAEGPVLITGESGTGKELVARSIHRESRRSNAPFIAINCAGIPPELLESELFGHTAGAFTNARKERKGLFEEADGGTLLLDEIGEMPMEMQAKLLRVLQDGKTRPVGSNTEKQLDVRVIAVTNRKLENDVRAKKFREDLYFRLETFSIEVPALRERGDDIEFLTAHFMNHYNLALQREVINIKQSALDCIKSYSFPGNVRELASAIERAIVFCRTDEIEASDLPERISFSVKNGDVHNRTLLAKLLSGDALPTLEEIERRYIEMVLDRFNGNKRRVAATLGISRRTLYRRLDENIVDKEYGDS